MVPNSLQDGWRMIAMGSAHFFHCVPEYTSIVQASITLQKWF